MMKSILLLHFGGFLICFLPKLQALAPPGCLKSRRVMIVSAFRGLMIGGAYVGNFPPLVAAAAETVGKDPNCNDSSCLGVWDGLLADCPHGQQGSFFGAASGGAGGCVSSQDDTPGIFAEPWDYSESENSLDWQVQMDLLKLALQRVSSRNNWKVEIDFQKGRYLRVTFVDDNGARSIGEFYFTPDDTTVQFRIAAQQQGGDAGWYSSARNIDRAELIRKELRYLKLPVLRNRKRSLFFVESDLDTFGPGSASLGPPAEMRTGELEGRQDVDPALKIDLLQRFPLPSK